MTGNLSGEAKTFFVQGVIEPYLRAYNRMEEMDDSPVILGQTNFSGT